MPPDRSWFFFDLPRPRRGAPHGQLMSYAAVHAFVRSRLQEAAEAEETSEVPEDLKRVLKAYMSRWHPEVEVPEE